MCPPLGSTGARERGSAGARGCQAALQSLQLGEGGNEVCLKRDSLLGNSTSKVIPASIESS